MIVNKWTVTTLLLLALASELVSDCYVFQSVKLYLEVEVSLLDGFSHSEEQLRSRFRNEKRIAKELRSVFVGWTIAGIVLAAGGIGCWRLFPQNRRGAKMLLYFFGVIYVAAFTLKILMLWSVPVPPHLAIPSRPSPSTRIRTRFAVAGAERGGQDG